MSGEGQHPDRERLAEFVAGRLSAQECLTIETHLESCETCVEVLAAVPPDRAIFVLQAAAKPGLAEFDTQTDSGNQSIPATAASHPSFTSATLNSVTDADCPVGEKQATVQATALLHSSAPPVALHVPPELADHPRYRILDVLGSGGMGVVYKAEHKLMNRTVALKVVRRELIDRPGSAERFEREVRTAARLSHPNIVAAYDAEQAGDVHFLVMEYVPGRSLADVLKDRGPLPVAEACDFIRQAACGLDHACRQGMVHRDIKPQNLIVTDDQQVKILDFGLARFVSESRSIENQSFNLDASTAAPNTGITRDGVVMGTPDYIAPEQVNDPRTADTRADIYSLGCTLYYLLTGRVPFGGNTSWDKMLGHLERTPQPIAKFRTDVPRAVIRVVDRMMAKDPSARFQSPQDVVAALVTVERSAANRRYRAASAVIAAVLLGTIGWLCYLNHGTVIRVLTNKGIVEIETDDASVRVEVLRAGELVKIIDVKSGRAVELTAGEYNLRLQDGPNDVQLVTDRFTLRRGTTEIVRVRRVEAPPSDAIVVAESDTPPRYSTPRVRNPFGLKNDAREPDGDDVRLFADSIMLTGDDADRNAKQWCSETVDGDPNLLDGVWESYWSDAGQGGVDKPVQCRTVGDRVFFLIRTNRGHSYLIEAIRQPGNRLAGRGGVVAYPADGPWAGVIVNPERIDGQWAKGRWDFRRKLKLFAFRSEKSLFRDEFDDATSGWLVNMAGPDGQSGYADGRYFHRAEAGRQLIMWGRSPNAVQRLSNFACELVGRVADLQSGQWGIQLVRDDGLRSATIKLDGSQNLIIESPEGMRRAALQDEAIRKGDAFNSLLVLVRPWSLEVFVNLHRVCQPIQLEGELSPCNVRLIGVASGGGLRAEFDRITIWPLHDAPTSNSEDR